MHRPQEAEELFVVPEKVSKFMASFGTTDLIRDAASEISQVATHPVAPMESPSIVKCVNTCSKSWQF